MANEAAAKKETITAIMSRWAADLKYEQLSSDAVYQAKRFLLDSVGCALGGYQQHDVKIALEVLAEIAGRGDCTVIGTGKKMDAVSASLANALMIRCMDYNDIYWKQDPSHPSDIFPAAMAGCERIHSNGKELIVGLVLGHEFEMRLCEAAFPGIRERGWHHATLTAFASPFVAGRALHLTWEQIQHAIGISASRHCTLGAVTAGKLTMMKNTVDPMATQSGVLAALLAEKGYTGPEHVIDGKEGIVHCFGPDWKLNLLTDGLGESWRITQCGMKFFPTEALTHAPISAVLDLVKENDLHPDNVAKIEIHSLARAKDILSDPSKYDPHTKETADHSLPYVIAAALVNRQVTPAQFEMKKIMDPKIREQLHKVEVIADPEIEKAFPALQRVKVIITTHDGQTYEKQLDYPKGDPRNPLSDAEIEEKFAALAEGVLSTEAQQKLRAAIWNLENLASVSELMALMKADVKKKELEAQEGRMNIAELRTAADRGSVPAQAYLGICYLMGDEVPCDYVEAFRLLSAASAAGATRAMLNLGRMYAEGLGVPKNSAEAARLYEATAKRGEFLAQIEIARAFAHGNGVARDANSARRWYSAALAQESSVDAPEEIAEARAYVASAPG